MSLLFGFRVQIHRFLALSVILVVVSSILVAAEPVPRIHRIDDIAWVPQTWNNCGPATLSMSLDRWDISAGQEDIALLIRPNRNDGHVSIEQIQLAAAGYGMDSHYFPTGDLALVKAIVAAGFPVMMPTWHIDSPRNQMGHYRLVHGYNDETQEFSVRDSLEPVGYEMDYSEFDLLWRVFNRRMLVVYPAVLSDDFSRIASDTGSVTEMLEASLVKALAEIDVPPGLPSGMSAIQYGAYRDYNRAMAYTALGRYEDAVSALFSAFSKELPWRMLWYQSEVLESVFRVGDYDWIVQHTRAALAPYPYIEELWYWKGRAEFALGNMSAAEEAFRRGLEIQPGWDLAVQALEAMD